MKKVEVDVLVIALNKIEYDARLSNFIDTFDKNGLRIATVTLDDYEFVKSKENRFRVEVRENIKTIAKVVDFLTAGKNFLEFVVPKYVLCSDVYSLPLGVKFKKKVQCETDLRFKRNLLRTGKFKRKAIQTVCFEILRKNKC